MIVIDAVIGYIVAHFLAGHKEGERGRIRSLRFHIKNKYVVHIHHWFAFTLILGGLFLIGLYHTLLYGLLMGSAVQGLTYKDFYKLVYRKEDGGTLNTEQEKGRVGA